MRDKTINQTKTQGRLGFFPKMSLGLLFVLQAMSFNVFAQRVIVKMKTPSAYSKIFSSGEKLVAGGSFTSKSQQTLMDQSFPNVKISFQASLGALQSFVAYVRSAEDLENLKNNPNVEFVDVEVFHPGPSPLFNSVLNASSSEISFKPGSATPWGILAVKAIEGWALSGKGEKSRVLVLDTGVDKNHIAIKDNFVEGRNFYPDPVAPQNTPSGIGNFDGSEEVFVDPGNFQDTQGHGTHVSGTILGTMNPQTGFTGVAPRAHLLAGRVCGEKGCSNIAITQGINWAIEKNVQVINMSLGGQMATPSERRAVKMAYEKGISIVAASGNDGEKTVGKVIYPAALDQVIAVGAVNSQLEKAKFSQFGPELAITAPGVDVVSSVPSGMGRESQVEINVDGTGYKIIEGSTAFAGGAVLENTLENELVYAGLGRAEDYANLNVAGKFVLVRRGEIRFSEKAQRAIEAKASGLIIFNNELGAIHGSVASGSGVMPILVFGIDQKSGEEILKVLEAKRSVKGKVSMVAVSYASFDGTSMASPHVAGVVALMKSANPGLSPRQVKEIIRKTAVAPKQDNSKNEYGAGIINAEEAVKESLQTKPEKMNSMEEKANEKAIEPGAA